MEHHFSISHPIALLIPILCIFLVLQWIARKSKQRGKDMPVWLQPALILLVVAIAFVFVFAKF